MITVIMFRSYSLEETEVANMEKGWRAGLVVVILILIAVSGFAGHTVHTERMTCPDIYNAALKLREVTDPKKFLNLSDIEGREGGSAEDSEEETERRTEANVPAVKNTSQEDRPAEPAEPVEDHSSDQEDNSASIQNTIVPSVTYITCPSCGGAGWFTCGICGGTGQQYIPNLYYDAVMGWTGGYQGCSGCGGSGGTVCSTCGGTGQVTG